jgi:hypothetical protein
MPRSGQDGIYFAIAFKICDYLPKMSPEQKNGSNPKLIFLIKSLIEFSDSQTK